MSVQNSHQISDIKVLLKIGANGNGIVSVEKTGTVGNVDTYTITFSDGTTTNFDVTNGTSIDTIEKTDTQGLTDTYTITLTDGSTTSFEVVNGGYDVGDQITATGNPLSFTTDSSQVAQNTIITLEPIQAGTGDPSPSNVRAISGYDEIELRTSNYNLVCHKIPNTSIGNASQHGAIVSNTSNDVFVVKVTQGEKYTIVNGDSSNIVAFYYAMPSLGMLSYNEDRLSGSTTYTAPITGYMAVRLNNTNNSEIFGVVAGEDTKVLNKLTDISILLDETVYGGTWDVESGELKVNWSTVNMGDLSWTYDSTNTRFYTTVNDRMYGATGNTICDIYKSEVGSSDNNKVIWGGGNNTRIYVKDTDYTVANTFKTAVTGHYIAYMLVTPIVIHLDPHQVKLLQGANVVTSNGTSISLKWREGQVMTLADMDGIADSIEALNRTWVYDDYVVQGDGTTTWRDLLQLLQPIYNGLTDQEKTYSKIIIRADEPESNECLTYVGAYWYARDAFNSDGLLGSRVSLVGTCSRSTYYNGAFSDDSLRATSSALALRVLRAQENATQIVSDSRSVSPDTRSVENLTKCETEVEEVKEEPKEVKEVVEPIEETAER